MLLPVSRRFSISSRVVDVDVIPICQHRIDTQQANILTSGGEYEYALISFQKTTIRCHSPTTLTGTPFHCAFEGCTAFFNTSLLKLIKCAVEAVSCPFLSLIKLSSDANESSAVMPWQMSAVLLCRY